MNLAVRSTTPISAAGSQLVARRACSCGGTCSSCSSDRRRQLARRSAASGRSGGQDFSRVPAHGTPIRVGPADDAFEREAETVAAAVAKGDTADPALRGPGHVQRDLAPEAAESAPAVETAEELGGTGAEDEGADADGGEDTDDSGADDEFDNPTGQPTFAEGAFRGGGHATLPLGSSSGAAMEPGVRSSMEQALGHDFSSVRVHRDHAAERAASAIHARAFTVGSDVYFSSGEYRPASEAGRHLLAHELTHVVQQSGGSASGTVQRQPKPSRRRRATPPTTPTPGRRRSTARHCTVHGRPGKKPCGPATCDGNCSGPTNALTHNPCCGNETCPTSAAVDANFFIRHLDVNRASQQTTAEWGTRGATLDVATFLTSPNASHTPTGSHTIGEKCGPCHTNGDGDGMAWLAGFSGIQFGFHNSQRVARGTQSHGCVRVAGCACAREIHDNTWSGVTSVCVHDGRHCGRPQPRSGAVDSAHSSVCGTLHAALPPAPAGPAPTRNPRGGSGHRKSAGMIDDLEPQPEGGDEVA